MNKAVDNFSKTLGGIMNQHVAKELVIDPEPLFYIITEGFRKALKHLLLEVGAVQQQFRIYDVSNIGHHQSSNKLTNWLANSMKQAAHWARVENGLLMNNSLQSVFCISNK